MRLSSTRGDDEAERRLGRLYERHAAAVAAYAYRRASAEDAADAVAETFLVAWRRIDDVPPEPEALPWLYGVARRVMSNQRRGTRRRTHLADRIASRLVRLEEDGPCYDDRETVEEVISMLDRLPPDDAEILRLTAWEMLTSSEIATVLGISEGAARKRLFRARRRLTARMADGLGDPSRAGPSQRPLPETTTTRHHRSNHHHRTAGVRGTIPS